MYIIHINLLYIKLFIQFSDNTGGDDDPEDGDDDVDGVDDVDDDATNRNNSAPIYKTKSSDVDEKDAETVTDLIRTTIGDETKTVEGQLLQINSYPLSLI